MTIHWTHTHVCPAFCFIERPPMRAMQRQHLFYNTGSSSSADPFCCFTFLTHFTQLTSWWREDKRSSEILQDVLMPESGAWNINNVSFRAKKHLWIKKNNNEWDISACKAFESNPVFDDMNDHFFKKKVLADDHNSPPEAPSMAGPATTRFATFVCVSMISSSHVMCGKDGWAWLLKSCRRDAAIWRHTERHKGEQDRVSQWENDWLMWSVRRHWSPREPPWAS